MRRVMRRVAVVLATAACAAWVMHVPYRPRGLVRAIPYGARWISRHHVPARRWEALRQSRALHMVGRLLGVAEMEWRGLLEHPDTAAWVRRLGAREIWLFNVPGGGPTTIGGAAWLGGSAWRWRVALQAGWIRGWRRYADHRGRTIWVWPRRLGTNGPYVAFALEEGILLACVSDRPADVIRLLDAYDGTAPRSSDPARLHGHLQPDVLLFQFGRGPGPDLIKVAFSALDGPHARGLAMIEGWELVPPNSTQQPLETNRLPPLVAAALNRAAATFILPAHVAESWGPRPLPAWLMEMRALFRSCTGAPWLLAMYDEPLAGRLSGIRIPGLTLSMPLTDLTAFERQLDTLLDRWNATWQWGLIRGPTPGAPQVQTIESTGSSALRRWLGTASPCYIWTEGWITFAGSTDTMQMLLAAEKAAPAESTLRAPNDGQAHAHIRGAPFASALRTAAAAYVLYRTLTDPERTASKRAAVLAAIPTLDVLRELDQLDASIRDHHGHWYIEFTARFAQNETETPFTTTVANSP